MIVKEALDILAQEIGLVFDAAVAQLAFGAPVFEGVLGDMEQVEQVGEFDPVEQDWRVDAVIVGHNRWVFDGVWQGSWHHE